MVSSGLGILNSVRGNVGTCVCSPHLHIHMNGPIFLSSAQYYVRVAAQNSVPVQKLATGAEDNTKWSGVLSAIPQDMPPQPPRAVSLFTLDGSTIQVNEYILYRTY